MGNRTMPVGIGPFLDRSSWELCKQKGVPSLYSLHKAFGIIQTSPGGWLYKCAAASSMRSIAELHMFTHPGTVLRTRLERLIMGTRTRLIPKHLTTIRRMDAEKVNVQLIEEEKSLSSINCHHRLQNFRQCHFLYKG